MSSTWKCFRFGIKSDFIRGVVNLHSLHIPYGIFPFITVFSTLRVSLALSFTTSIILRRHRTVPTRFLNESSFGNIGSRILPRKEVIQPHLPVRLPCYDFTPVTTPALGRCLRMVSSRTSGVDDSHGVTGGVYKTRERIQRSVLICVY